MIFCNCLYAKFYPFRPISSLPARRFAALFYPRKFFTTMENYVQYHRLPT